MTENARSPQGGARRSAITKEFLVGLLAIGLGGYNLLAYAKYAPEFPIPRLLADGVLLVAGIILWITAFRLWRYRYHTSRLF